MTDPALITESKYPEMIALLRAGNFEEVIRLTDFTKPMQGKFWNLIDHKKQQHNKPFSHVILHSCLTHCLDPGCYHSSCAINFTGDYGIELKELQNFLHVLQQLPAGHTYVNKLSLTL